MILYSTCEGGFYIKYLNEIEIIEFAKKYFPMFIGDIKSVSYIDYEKTREYLVNRHYIFIVKIKETSII